MFELKCVLKISWQTRHQSATRSRQSYGDTLEKVVGTELFRDEGYFVCKRVFCSRSSILFSGDLKVSCEIQKLVVKNNSKDRILMIKAPPNNFEWPFPSPKEAGQKWGRFNPVIFNHLKKILGILSSEKLSGEI